MFGTSFISLWLTAWVIKHVSSTEIFQNWDKFLHRCHLVQKQTQKARGFTETNSPVIFSVSRVGPLCLSTCCQQRSRSFIRKQIKSLSTATQCWEYFIWEREIKSKCVQGVYACVCNPYFEAMEIFFAFYHSPACRQLATHHISEKREVNRGCAPKITQTMCAIQEVHDIYLENQ